MGIVTASVPQQILDLCVASRFSAVLQAPAAAPAAGTPSLLQREGQGAILLATWQEHRTAQALAQAQAAAAHSLAAQMEAEVSALPQGQCGLTRLQLLGPTASLAHAAGLCTQLEPDVLQLCSMLCAAAEGLFCLPPSAG